MLRPRPPDSEERHPYVHGHLDALNQVHERRRSTRMGPRRANPATTRVRWWSASRSRARDRPGMRGTAALLPLSRTPPSRTRALTVLASRPAAGSALAFLQFLLGPPDAALSGGRLLRVLHPADELVARQGGDAPPGGERGGAREQRLTQVYREPVHHSTGHAVAVHGGDYARSPRAAVKQFDPRPCRDARRCAGAVTPRRSCRTPWTRSPGRRRPVTPLILRRGMSTGTRWRSFARAPRTWIVPGRSDP
jgi:hypothetical protein